MKEKIVILGGGESGVGAAILAKMKGFEVFLSDNGLIPSEKKQTLKKYDIEFEEGVVSFSIGDDKYVINRHVPSKQIWLATPNFKDHFSYDEESERWLNEEGDSLFELLARELDIDLRD